MATKEQELKALEKIRKIVEELGETSYIKTAFDGCFEIAEENIKCDFGCSMKQRWESAEEKLEAAHLIRKNLEDKIAVLRIGLNQKDDAIARLEDAKNQLSKELEEVKAAYEKLEFKLERAKETADDLRQTILELKAKLYDMMVREEVKG